jgi:dihydrolipoamide dehydrogenase
VTRSGFSSTTTSEVAPPPPVGRPTDRCGRYAAPPGADNRQEAAPRTSRTTVRKTSGEGHVRHGAGGGGPPVDKQQRTNVSHIFAIGDVVGQPMLAHKATHEGKVVAENTAGKNSYFDATVIPSVAYTDPEVALVGVTENEAHAAGVKYGKGVFPWAASGRSLSLGRDEGLTTLLFADNDRIIGAGIVGPNAGELIAEAAVAIEMGGEAADIGATIHPHPTLSETVGLASEAFEGTITDLYLPKKNK